MPIGFIHYLETVLPPAIRNLAIKEIAEAHHKPFLRVFNLERSLKGSGLCLPPNVKAFTHSVFNQCPGVTILATWRNLPATNPKIIRPTRFIIMPRPGYTSLNSHSLTP
jgi:hypothetical protein